MTKPVEGENVLDCLLGRFCSQIIESFFGDFSVKLYEFSNCLRWQVIIPAFSISPVDFLIGTS